MLFNWVLPFWTEQVFNSKPQGIKHNVTFAQSWSIQWNQKGFPENFVPRGLFYWVHKNTVRRFKIAKWPGFSFFNLHMCIYNISLFVCFLERFQWVILFRLFKFGNCWPFTSPAILKGKFYHAMKSISSVIFWCLCTFHLF